MSVVVIKSRVNKNIENQIDQVQPPSSQNHLNFLHYSQQSQSVIDKFQSDVKPKTGQSPQQDNTVLYSNIQAREPQNEENKMDFQFIYSNESNFYRKVNQIERPSRNDRQNMTDKKMKQKQSQRLGG